MISTRSTRRLFKPTLLALAVAGMPLAANAADELPTAEEMWRIIKDQQQQISELKQKIDQTDEKVEYTAVAVEQVAASGDSKLSQWAEKTTFGGYGELHYNNLDNQIDGGKADKDELDLHRFVLFFGHQFTDKVRFYSELEVEHSIAGDGKVGEVEVEQAFIEWDYASNHRAKGGVFLMPVGILNETHEPDTFYGVERNPVEKNVIPATWWEGGVNLSGQIVPGLSYDAAATSGLFLDDGEYKIRDGRQKVGKAKADDLAYTGRIKYTGIAGLELAATVQYQTDLLQSEFHSSGAAEVDATLFEVHAAYTSGSLALRALYARWDINEALELTKAGASEQEGWYIEPSYKLTDKWGVFARYGQWDNQAGDSADSEYQQTDIGVNYWLTDTVVLKLDYQDQSVPSGKDEYDGFNLGVGWSF